MLVQSAVSHAAGALVIAGAVNILKICRPRPARDVVS